MLQKESFVLKTLFILIILNTTQQINSKDQEVAKSTYGVESWARKLQRLFLLASTEIILIHQQGAVVVVVEKKSSFSRTFYFTM